MPCLTFARCTLFGVKRALQILTASGKLRFFVNFCLASPLLAALHTIWKNLLHQAKLAERATPSNRAARPVPYLSFTRSNV
ncbi:hypothetical protein ETA_07090 [Erwinia tasmaniensis Et1/99]|uniref:Uncharacterized protein n=1 Tax=Erwinia tasmaniensis (strain DSM 17950 / CFBP 7177 / CIP 109463 / NCPPB 4357 / Et1/99) TaxID=465817 RepID=B2VGR1_ERWT9|nr:hypothetical protein ETA_07090 [Erwinia tasmaniensis Et1/99]